MKERILFFFAPSAYYKEGLRNGQKEIERGDENNKVLGEGEIESWRLRQQTENFDVSDPLLSFFYHLSFFFAG